MADFRPATPGMPNWIEQGMTTLAGERIPKLLLNVGDIADVKLWGKSSDLSNFAFSDLAFARIQDSIADPADGLIMIVRVVGKEAGTEKLAALDAVDGSEQAHLIIQVVDSAKPAAKPAAPPPANDTVGDGSVLIERSPDFMTVAVGAKIRYSVNAVAAVPRASQRNPNWYVLYEAGTSPNWFARLIDDDTGDERHPGAGMSCVWAWDRPGVHTVFCRLDGPREYYSRKQVVRPLHDVARSAFAASHPVEEDPAHAAQAARGDAYGLRQILAAYPDAGSPAVRDDVEVHCDRLEGWAADVEDILMDCRQGHLYPVKAVLMVAENNQSVDLRVFIIKLDGGWRWWLIDYTDPASNHRSSSKYEIVAEDGALSAGDAIAQLIGEWQSNRYYSGEVLYEFPKLPGEGFDGRSGSFLTTGSNPLEKLADFLSTASLATLAAAAVSAALLPVPVAGPVVAELMLWSLVTSVASGALLTYNRVQVGEQTVTDTVFDVVQVATLLLPLGKYWAEGVRVSNVSAFVKGTNLSEAVFFGKTTEGTLNGMLIGANIARDLSAVLADQNMDPTERADRLQRLLVSAVAAGLILVIPSILAERELKYNDPERTINDLLEELGDSKKNVPLKRPPGKTPASEGKHEQTVATRKKPPPPRTGSTPKQPPPAEERGLRPQDDAGFADLARQKKWYILVRDSNKAAAARIGKPGFAPKPMSVKAKTLDAGDLPAPKPENIGLAAANPASASFQKLLESVKLKKGDPSYDYAKYKADMEEDGYGIEETNDYLVFQKSPQKAYLYSDADLHGLYTQDGKLVPFSLAIQKEFTDAFDGVELVQHASQDEWLDRLKPEAEPNRGPQVKTTVYLPDGTKQHLTDIPTMRQFYLEHGLPWDATWGPEFSK